MEFPRVKYVPWIAGICAGCALASTASATLGEDFGTRDPAVCPMRDAPRTGALSLQQATRYFECDTEHVGDTGEKMYLVSNLQLQVGKKGRAYDARTDAAADGIDPAQSVFDIRGDFRLYQCGRKSSPTWQADPGHACRYQDFYGLQGICWKDQRADWHCAMPYKFDIAHTVHDTAPPL